MDKAYIRVWQEIEFYDVAKHLLIVGSTNGDCSNCRHIGIDYIKAKSCPNCNTEFKFLASRANEVIKLKTKRPDLLLIDFADFQKFQGKLKAREFFKK